MGSLSYFTKGNLSEFNRLIIGEKLRYIKNIMVLERLFLAKFVRFVSFIYR